jgi:hypothetical protein
MGSACIMLWHLFINRDGHVIDYELMTFSALTCLLFVIRLLVVPRLIYVYYLWDRVQ